MSPGRGEEGGRRTRQHHHLATSRSRRRHRRGTFTHHHCTTLQQRWNCNRYCNVDAIQSLVATQKNKNKIYTYSLTHTHTHTLSLSLSLTLQGPPAAHPRSSCHRPVASALRCSTVTKRNFDGRTDPIGLRPSSRTRIRIGRWSRRGVQGCHHACMLPRRGEGSGGGGSENLCERRIAGAGRLSTPSRNFVSRCVPR
ncbi:hypothetical protein LY76DRAFT_223812 [Colletotrichum caudatum]|nr:hypothetical protein LY76DRAFT_223812 [Colletotrichum caudatum]